MVGEINKRLDAITEVLDKDATNKHIEHVRKILKPIGDVQRWARRPDRTIYPYRWQMLSGHDDKGS
jgi:DNA mismatch repair ATPase MutS